MTEKNENINMNEAANAVETSSSVSGGELTFEEREAKVADREKRRLN